MPRYRGRRQPDNENREGRQNGEHNEEQGRSWVGNPNPHRQGRMSDETRYQQERDMRAGEKYGRPYRTTDCANDQMTPARTTGRESDIRSNERYDRYGMDNEDWRHMDDYWQAMYGDAYPREKEWNRGQGMGLYAGRGPRNYKRSDDRIQEDLNEQLTRHPMIDATEIEVSVHKGQVVLRGTVDQVEMKQMAEGVAKAVFGVKDVRNEIKVRKAEWRESERAA